jgi:hypothetical protein
MKGLVSGPYTRAIVLGPMIKHREIECSDDLEILEIVSPANFKTTIVEAPE